MNFIGWFLALSVLALLGDNLYLYLHAKGTLWQRLAACGRGSLTVFVKIWGGIAVTGVMALDTVAGITSDPQFMKLSDQLNALVPAQYHPIFPAVETALVIWARQRTLKKP